MLYDKFIFIWILLEIVILIIHCFSFVISLELISLNTQFCYNFYCFMEFCSRSRVFVAEGESSEYLKNKIKAHSIFFSIKKKNK